MISVIVLSCIISQAAVAIYFFNTLKLKDDFEKKLNAILLILLFHLGTKFFILVILKDAFLYNNNATGFGLSYGPLLYMTARSYIKQPLAQQFALLHLLPFVFFTLAYFINSAGYVIHIIPGTFIAIYSSWYHGIVAASLFIYPIITSRLLSRHLAAAQQPQERLLKLMAHIMLAGTILGSVIAGIHFMKNGYSGFDLRLVPYLCFAVLPVLILQYKMQPQPAPPQLPENKLIVKEERPERQYKKSALDKQMMNKYEITLKKVMEESKIYLETEISLEELSLKAKIPKHHLTQLLNERFEKNFYAFINEYRIKEAVKKLKDNADTNILSLAYDCGFNSKSSFNNYFKKVTGLTPSLYRKELFKRAEERPVPR